MYSFLKRKSNGSLQHHLGNEACVDLLLSYGAHCSSEIQTIIRENFPGFDGGKLTNTRAARPLKNILFNLIELGDNVDGLNSYVTARYDYNDF